MNTLYLSNKAFPVEECSRPFDNDRGGFIIGEGSGVLVLEEFNHALKRNAKIYCEIKGYGSFGDAHHLTKPMENGEGGFRAMLKCLVDANIKPQDIDVINCHATSTEVGDLAELNAIKNLFGNKKLNLENKANELFYDENFEVENIEENNENFNKEKLKNLVLSANKTYFGHLLGAAGAVESIFSILSIKDNFIIDNKNTNNPISNLFNFRYKESDFSKYNLENNLGSNKVITYVLKNSFAFGGVNTSILYKKFE